MTDNQYLESVIKTQCLSAEELKELEQHRLEIESLLREKIGSKPIIKYAGSKAKGTMIKENYDLDMVCYFLSDEGRTLKELYEYVKGILSAKYIVEPKASALRIKAQSNGSKIDYHIDVVPGKFIDETQKDVFLYVSTAEKERLKTNIKKHIVYISESNYKDVIKIVKLWRTRNNLRIKTFVLEILVVETLNDEKGLSLSEATICVLNNIYENIRSLKLVDPANSNNVLSDILSPSDKTLFSNKAKEALDIIKDS
ncbi:MAG: hypothetical protein AABY66_02335, partial [Nitrospirota bacterium]